MSSFCNFKISCLFISFSLEIIETCSSIINISKFREIFVSVTSHLKNRHHNSKVISSCKVASLIILKISDTNSPIQINKESSQMWSGEDTESSKGSGFFYFFRVIDTSSYFKVNWFMNSQMICIQDKKALFLISCIDYFEDLSSNKIIIAINNCHDFATVTQSSGSIINIWKCFFIDSILNEMETGFWNLIFINVTSYFVCSSIFWSVININDMIILIVLLKNRVQVSEIFVLIFVAWNNDTKRYFTILTYLVFLFIFKFFLKFHSLHFLE